MHFCSLKFEIKCEEISVIEIASLKPFSCANTSFNFSNLAGFEQRLPKTDRNSSREMSYLKIKQDDGKELLRFLTTL